MLRCARNAATELAPERVSVPQLLKMSGRVRDSVGLSAAQRQHNVAGRIGVIGQSRPGIGRPRSRTDELTVLLVDDVVTTGATLAECAGVLTDFGISLAGAIVVASA